MKKRLYVYVLMLAVLFIGATGVTKASAEDGNYLVVWNLTLPEGCESVKLLDESDKEITRGTSIAAGTGLFAECVPSTGYKLTVTLDDPDTEIGWSGGNKYGFIMPAKDVTLTITATKNGTPSATPTPTAGVGISEATPDYNNEYVNVTSDKQVFFQIVKSAEPGELKPANWIKAAANGDGKYAIDFSGTANTKDVFYALTVDASSKKPDKTVTVDAVIKSAKITLNYKTETLTTGNEAKGLYEVIGGFEVKGVDKADDKKWDSKTEGALDALYTLNWKRGANGTWAAASEFNQLNWDMVKASNSTLYINVSAKKGDKGMVTFRPSKETKLKVPKSAKAPTVKVDYVKGTLALKNGMQVRVNDNAAWVDIIAYDKTKTEQKDVFALASANEVTSTKVSNVAVADFVKAAENLLKIDLTAGEEITIEARTAATDKKFPSNGGFVKLVLLKAGPDTVSFAEISCVPENKEEEQEAFFELDFTKLMKKPTDETYEMYEYVLVGASAEGVNLSKQKWTKVPANGKVDLAKYIGKEYSWVKAGADQAVKAKYEEMDAIFVRKAAVKGSKTETGVFASEYSMIDVKLTNQLPGGSGDNEISLVGKSMSATILFYVDDKQVEKAKEGSKVVTVPWTTVSELEIDEVFLQYNLVGDDTKGTKIFPVNGVYSFIMPDTNKVTVEVTYKTKETAAK